MIQTNDRRVNEQKWRERIHSWEESGQAPMAWCRQNNIAYHRFAYWRQRVNGSPKSEPSRFIELPQELCQDHVGLKIEIGGASLTVDREFDEETFLKVVRSLRRA
jgi:hypothetical protein